MTNSNYNIDNLAQTPSAKFPKNYFTEKDLLSENVEKVSKAWVDSFDQAIKNNDPDSFDNLVDDGGFWRDVIAFTNDYRSIAKYNIHQAASTRLSVVEAKEAQFENATAVSPYDDFTFIEVSFVFTTKLGPSTGLAHLVKTDVDEYKAFILFTALDGIHGNPERARHNRIEGTHNGERSYDEYREDEIENPNPDVIIVGAGHGGLQVAAHLQAFGMRALVVDRERRIGDNWRSRYSSLSLHDPCYSLHFAYMKYPETWPKYPSAGKLAHWLEHYAESLELNVWTKSEVIPSKTSFDEKSQKWTVTINHGDKEERTFTVSHVVLSTGMSGGKPWFPDKAPGQDKFEGRILHSTQAPDGGKNFQNEKLLIVGTGSSAHDLALDCVRKNANVTMLQRSPTYIMSIKNGMKNFVETTYNEDSQAKILSVDKSSEALPKSIVKLHHQRAVQKVANLDKELLNNLNRSGFRTFLGPEDTGFIFLAMQKGGGYYYNSGASDSIINGDIKIQPGEIEKFTCDKEVVFKDGTRDKFDSVVFCTGYTGYDDSVREILGEEYATKLKPIWGLDEETELKGVFRDCGIPNCYFMVGALNIARFNSRMIALQILAEREGKFGDRYTIEAQKSKN